MRKSLFAGLIVVMVSVGAIAPLAAAAPTDDPDINQSAEHAPDVFVHEDMVTIAEHDRQAMTGPLEYYDDNGNIADLGDRASINDSENLPVGVRYTQMDDSFLNTFPRVSGESENSVSAVDDTSDWTAATTGGTTSISDNDGGTATGVDSVKFSTTAMVSGDTATYSYSNFSVDQDATKRVAMVAANVQNMDPGTTVEFRFKSTDGDYKSISVNQSGAVSDEGVLADSNGTNLVAQAKMADLATEGSGDGTLEDIQTVEVYVADGNADVTLVGLDTERKSKVNLGETERDTDNDGEMETTMIEDHYEGGELRLTGLDTLPSQVDSATIRNLKVYNLKYGVDKTGDSWNNVSISDAEDYPSYDTQLDAYYKVDVPAAIDLSHGSLDLKAEQNSPGNWYNMVGYATNIGDTNISNASYTDSTSAFSTEGETVTLATGLSAGEYAGVHIKKVLTADAAAAIQDTGSDENAGGGGFFGDSDGGIAGMILSPFGGAISALLAFLGLKNRGSSGSGS